MQIIKKEGGGENFIHHPAGERHISKAYSPNILCPSATIRANYIEPSISWVVPRVYQQKNFMYINLPDQLIMFFDFVLFFMPS